ncbi:MAG: DUF1080 domain-containing protein [Bryobacterales bacterium]|nr:DUF1080 domain-containing protein [Bryobacterales bacterium]
MIRIAVLFLIALVQLPAAEEGWISLFNGKDLTGWRVNENPGTFSVKNGAIVAQGPRSHCFYVGDVANHSFRQFELQVEAMTEPKANGGIYILTDFQEKGWPGAGFEVQVNNSFPGDFRKTGSLYQVLDVKESLAADNQWFTEHITVKGDTITVLVNGKEAVRWTQPAGWEGTQEFPQRRLRSGTIALQGHDPGSTVYYRNIRIRLLK